MREPADVLQAAQARIEKRRGDLGTTAVERVAGPRKVSRSAPEAPDSEQLGREDAYATLVPDGLYDVAFESIEKGWCFGREIAFALFRIVEHGEHFGLPLMRFVNLPQSWRGKRVNAKARLARSSTLCRDWLSIRGTRPPGHVFSLQSLYGGRVLRAQVAQVRQSHGEGGPLEVPEAARYSKIVRFVSPETAAPREGR